MSHCQAALLLDRGVLHVTGADAGKFLQGIVTSDVDKIEDGGVIHAALLSPQGKILFDFFVVADHGGFFLEAPRDTLADLAKRLGFYRLRAEVNITQAPDVQVAAIWDGAANLPDSAIAFADPRLPALGTRVLVSTDCTIRALACDERSADDYHAHRIQLGVPEGGRDYPFGDTFPHEALLDQLNGVDFEKGCFVGQEVVSRMEHRGTARKRIVPVKGDAPLHSGTEVRAGDMPIGQIGSADGKLGLALLRLDRAGDAAAKGTKLTAGGAAITLLRPAFAQFDIPTALPA